MSAIYPKFKETLLGADISFSTMNIKVALVSTKYDYSTSHQFLSSVLSSQAVKRSTTNLSSKTVTGGVADAADVTLPSVSGVKVEALVFFRDTGSSATSDLIAYVDQGTGLPFTPSGVNVSVVWDNGTNKLFRL